MPWVRLDEQFAKHPKVAQAGPLGMAMQVAALCYCNQYLTDGFIPRAVVPGLLDLEGLEHAGWRSVVEDLLTAGLWGEVTGGYYIHDYLDFQPSRAEVEAERERNRIAGRKGGEAAASNRRARRGAEHSASAPLSEVPSDPCSEIQAEAVAKSKPVPVPVTDKAKATPPTPPRGDCGPSSFDDFWAAYPRRENKGAARRAWATAAQKGGAEEVVAGAERYAADPNRDPAFTAHPATWLRGERWTDEPLPPRSASPPRLSNVEQSQAAIRRVLGSTVDEPDRSSSFAGRDDHDLAATAYDRWRDRSLVLDTEPRIS